MYSQRIVFLSCSVLALGALTGLTVSLSATVAEEAGVKTKVCQAVGCPDTSTRLCAEVSGEVSVGVFSGTVNYQCYEPPQ